MKKFIKRTKRSSCFALLLFPVFSYANIFTVNVNSGTGVGSFKWAIDQANATGGTDTITFAPALVGPVLTDALASISDPVHIDGASWEAANGGKLEIQLSMGGGGSYATELGFSGGSDGSSLSNLAITGGLNGGNAVFTFGTSNITISNNYFQLNSAGNTTVNVGAGGNYPTNNLGIYNSSNVTANNNVFGRASSGGFSDHIIIDNSPDATISNNTMGFFADGSNQTAFGGGIVVTNSSNDASIQNNQLGNLSQIAIAIFSSSRVSIDQNTVGFQADQTTAASLSGGGIIHGITFGGGSNDGSITNNVIGNIQNNGISAENSSNLTITGNRSGIDISDNCAGNGWSGLSLSSITTASISNNILSCNNNENLFAQNSSGLTISNNTLRNSNGDGITFWTGVTGSSVTGNNIAENGGDGIQVNDGTSSGVSITQNSISCNGSNTNDGINISGGANGGISAPAISVYGANTTSGTGTAGATIHFYRSISNTGTACEDCEGEIYIGSTTVDGGGAWSLTHNLGLANGNEGAVTATQTNGSGSTSAFGGCDNPPLPVEWSIFKGKHQENVNVLHWTTTIEVNNEIFIIERSADGINFTEIGTVSGAGNSNAPINYYFEDVTLEFSSYYYRIKQVDYDGQFEYSKIIYVKSDVYDEEFLIYPNPANTNDQLTVRLGDEGDVFTLLIMSELGQTITLLDGFSSGTSFDLGQLIPGCYVVKALKDSQVYYTKLIVQ